MKQGALWGFIPARPPFVPNGLSFPLQAVMVEKKEGDAMLFRLEWKKLCRPVLLTTVLLSVFCGILVPIVQRSYSLFYPVESWEVAMPWLNMLYPLFVTVPVCWQLYYERRNRFITYTLPRVSPRRYLTAKYLACALSAFLIMFIPYVLSGLCAVYLVKPQNLSMPYAGYTHVWLTLFTQFPAVYVLLLSLWKGLLGVLTMTFGFVLALYGRNIFVILIAPFVYTFLDNLFWGSFFGKGLGLYMAFEPSNSVARWVRGATFFAGPGLLLAVIALVWLFEAKLRHREVYPL